MGWYYNYRPYVSVAERRQKAQREMEKRRKQGKAVSPVAIAGRTIASASTRADRACGGPMV